MFKIRKGWMLGIVLVTVACLVAYSVLSGPPSDATLERNFPWHETDFDQIIAMAQQDRHLDRIDPKFTFLDTDASWPRANVGLTPERWNRYRDLFRHAGLPAGIGRNRNGTIFLPVYSSGFVVAGTEKGYAYSEKTPSPIVDSLNTSAVDSNSTLNQRGSWFAFKPFKKNWYLYRGEN